MPPATPSRRSARIAARSSAAQTGQNTTDLAAAAAEVARLEAMAQAAIDLIHAEEKSAEANDSDSKHKRDMNMLTDELKDSPSEKALKECLNSIRLALMPLNAAATPAEQPQPPEDGIWPPWNPPAITKDRASLVHFGHWLRIRYGIVPHPPVVPFQIKLAGPVVKATANFLWRHCNGRILEIVLKAAGWWTQENEDDMVGMWRTWVDAEGNWVLDNDNAKLLMFDFCFPIYSLL
ncbi:MAG: hypothetical protein LQ344_007985 [Seirophora lacunosa]|nr:MAG: hypothetical protein LQ344_007985 [Seirophora lacunosa]